MCICTPEKRTPWCPNCKPDKTDAGYQGQRADMARRIRELEADVTNARRAAAESDRLLKLAAQQRDRMAIIIRCLAGCGEMSIEVDGIDLGAFDDPLALPGFVFAYEWSPSNIQVSMKMRASTLQTFEAKGAVKG